MSLTPQIEQELDLFREDGYREVDRFCEIAIRELGSGCQPGCSYCCRNLVTVSLIEALTILRTTAGLVAFMAKWEQIKTTARLFMQRHPDTRLAPWRERNEPCPFLTDCGRCAVYEVRPFNCRTHIAARPCVEDQEGNDYIDPTDGTNISMMILAMAEERTGIPMAIAPLPVALIFAWDILQNGLDVVTQQYRGTPFLDPFEEAMYWSYIEL